ncbi:uncharacterized protein [Spinacia oleracea]|uniref:Uncharacterized protein isoform X1 n=1 Tax=Spinacia oleracea TaxID=3562 RepID=A0ABM3QW22_SPIOL|nr:uncharacterized protein LOC130462741 isoform X1 [Spinacia oleracea]XP_056693986.1 uncharacterized protein LOC130468966 isoform X1 [Spinacia oleracea]XP_056693987.1 uncharacterized protein LOC130468966 isoform X1 [Spinacia oleracea]XP_056699026.1 uncharacterized protein LOC130472351 isoform X1 [Spinacia oleracea]XP_056699027.1 uncharacterized protein LOC130472351 isoform X1 [Spinacia oleracea]
MLVQKISSEHNGSDFILLKNLKLKRSYGRDPRRTDYAWGILSLAYQVYKCNGGHCPNKTSFKSCKPIHIECAQQIGGTECGYYVMKFMLEIVTLQHDYEGRLDEVYTPRTAPYASEEIDVVREQWAKFFTTKYLLLT